MSEEIAIVDNNEYIDWNDKQIVITENEILLRSGSGNHIKNKSIAGFGMKILYYAVDKFKNNIKIYTFQANGKLFYSYEINKFLSEYKDELFEGNLSKNTIRKIFSVKSKSMIPRRAEYINGWNNGWKLPINHKESDYMLICQTDEQRIVLNSVLNAYKKYSDEEKINLYKILNNFFDITEYDTICATITAAWSMAALFKGYFMKYMKIFPLLGAEGLRNTGKTSYMNIMILYIWNIFDTHIDGGAVDSVAAIPQAMISGAFPLYLDDMQIYSEKFISLAKESSTSQSYHTKYKPDGSIREKAKRVASISMSSNTDYMKIYFGDLANNSRAINLHPEKLTSKNKKWVKLGLKIKEAKMLSLVLDYTEGWIDKDLDKLVKEVEKKYNIAKKIKTLGNKEFINKNYPRIGEIYTIILVGVELWERIFKVKLKMVNNILETLIKSRGHILSELINYFLIFCVEAKNYNLGDIEERDGKEVVVTKNHPYYLKHELIINSKDWGLFTVTNMKEFSKMCETKFRGLDDLCNQLLEGLEKENKDLLFVHKTTWKRQDIRCIKVSPELLKYDMSEIDDPYINPLEEELTEEEVEKQMEKAEEETKKDEDSLLDFDDEVVI